jgi:shikimate dehydrogenase
MVQLGSNRISIFDIDHSAATELAATLGTQFGGERAEAVSFDVLAERLATADGVVHATPSGMAGHPGTAFPPELLRPQLWVADVVYRPLETDLLRRARRLGCRTLDGGGMAVFQAAESFSLFTGLEPDPDCMLAHFAELVTAERALPDGLALV